MGIINKLVGKAHNVTSGLDAKLNFDPTQNLTYTIDGKKTNIDNITIDPESFRIYIGAMDKKHQETYTDELIIGMIHYLMQVEKLEHTTIVLGTPVSKIFNDDPNKMTIEMQKSHLESLIKKNFWRRTLKKVTIQSIDREEHQNVFHLIKEWYRQSINEPELNVLNSTELWKYLYRLYANNKDFAHDIQKTKPQELQNSVQADLYGITEIAIRLTDFLQGITLQWGVKRQEKYDKIITNLLNPYYPNYEECKQLRNIIKRQEPAHFRTLYFDTNKTHNVVEKTEKAKQTKSKMRNVILLTWSLLLATISWWVSTSKYLSYKHIKKIEQTTENSIEQMLEWVTIMESSMYHSTELKTLEAKKKFIYDIIDKLCIAYIELYNNTEEPNDKEMAIIKNIVTDELLRDEQYQIFSNGMYTSYYVQEFLMNNVIKKHKNSFNSAWLSATMYPKLEGLQDAIKNTLLHDDKNDEVVIRIPEQDYRIRENDNMPDYIAERKRYEKSISWWNMNNAYMYRWNTTYAEKLEYIWQYGIYNTDYNMMPDWWCVAMYQAIGGKQYIIAWWLYNDNLTTDEWKTFLYRYLYNNDPTIQETINTYREVFTKHEIDRYNYHYNFQRDGVVFTRDILPAIILNLIKEQERYDKIKNSLSKRSTIIEYIEKEFLPKHHLEQEFERSKLNTQPYPNMRKHYDAIQNTLHVDRNIIPAWFWSSGIDNTPENTQIQHREIIWPYVTTDGKPYIVAVATIDGKEYIYVQDDSKWAHNKDFYIYYAQKVAKDFLDNYCQE